MLQDRYQRKFSYLRLSITDVCNFRCQYCLPNGYHKNKKNFLTINEIKNLTNAFVELGIQKIRITGGEPTTRKNFLQIGKMISSFNEIKTLAFTTNGYKLNKIAKECKNVGFNGVNVSIDSLDNKKFYTITGHNKLNKILNGIHKSISVNLKTKINVVLIKNFNNEDLLSYIKLAKILPISIRFIELMETNATTKYFKKHHINPNYIKEYLLKNNWRKNLHKITNGPAIEYSNKEYKGQIGIISPYSKNFCSN